ncbi:Nuclear protein localization protein 4 [Purpureocillium lavendulum]|uniref:Nuclear protein localization protein 4 n=1 Tax=Purpureocillium lavendulum TaxID=1247861 RepID=A0AB34G212_9HYPO|nr:Nuclear protein localization protein 4 [Purpureocillium lavendulum]
MSDPGVIASRVRADLERYVKPREQVNYIRRILALHLGSFTGDGPVVQPLSLVDHVTNVENGKEISGIQREYISALKANVAARREFDETLHDASQQTEPPSRQRSSDPDFLQEQLALLRLRRQRKCLLAVEGSLDHLAEKPASFQSFLDADDMFHASRPLPGVPQAVLNSFVKEQSGAQPDLNGRLHHLEKTVLRAKLLQKQEEHALAAAKTRYSKSNVSNGAKLEALNATRDELIAWIETELGKAASEEAAGSSEDSQEEHRGRSDGDEGAITTQLEQIQRKYSAYIVARKRLVDVLAHRPQPSMPPPTEQSSETGRQPTDGGAPVNHLLIPYIEKLLSVSRQQKAAITQKSHINAVLAKRNKDTHQVLDRLAEESQLLPSHPVKASRAQRSGLQNDAGTKSSDRLGISERVKPWAFAADAAKIATLEAVAETIDGGQVALENTMKSLMEIDHLLGRNDPVPGEDEAVEDATEDDVWLGGGGKGGAVRKHSEKKTKPTLQKGDPWSILHGNLGLIGHEDGA